MNARIYSKRPNSAILPFQNVNDEEFSSNLTVTEFAKSKMDIISKILQVTSKNVISITNLLKPPILFISHVNIKSLNKNIDKLEELLLELGKLPDIIALSETKLKNSFSCFLDGCKFIQSNSDTNAGGVGLLVRNNVSFIVTDQYELNVPNCEDLWIEVKQKNSKRKIFGVIYRHPNHHITDFQENLEKLLLKLNKNNLSYYI